MSSSRRPRRSSRSTKTRAKISTHPSVVQVDASAIDLRILRREIDETRGNKSSLLLERLDFLNVWDDAIIDLFIRDCHINRQTLSKILLPPKTHRRTLKQIKRWFGELGNRDKLDLIEQSASFMFASNHVTNLQWNDFDRC